LPIIPDKHVYSTLKRSHKNNKKEIPPEDYSKLQGIQ
jgi:hypothetical protein